MKLTSNKPYLVRAIYEWNLDNGLTPYIVVDTKHKLVNLSDTLIPYVNQDKFLVLNISPKSSLNLNITNDITSFIAKFNGVEEFVKLPTESIICLHSKETGQQFKFDINYDSEIEENSNNKEKNKNNHLKRVK